MHIANNVKFLPQGFNEIERSLYKHVWCFGQFKHLAQGHPNLQRALPLCLQFLTDLHRLSCNVKQVLTFFFFFATIQVTSKFYYRLTFTYKAIALKSQLCKFKTIINTTTASNRGAITFFFFFLNNVQISSIHIKVFMERNSRTFRNSR